MASESYSSMSQDSTGASLPIDNNCSNGAAVLMRSMSAGSWVSSASNSGV